MSECILHPPGEDGKWLIELRADWNRGVVSRCRASQVIGAAISFETCTRWEEGMPQGSIVFPRSAVRLQGDVALILPEELP